eukprot:8919822-Prorocentrum_lima.AAC.1
MHTLRGALELCSGGHPLCPNNRSSALRPPAAARSLRLLGPAASQLLSPQPCYGCTTSRSTSSRSSSPLP